MGVIKRVLHEYRVSIVCVSTRMKLPSEDSKAKVKSVAEEVLPHDTDFATRVLDTVHEGILGRIMRNAVSDAMDVILKKEVTKLADEVMRFRRILSEKMLADTSRSFKDPVCLEKLPSGFEAGWNEWKGDCANREELAYQAFVNEISPRQPTE